MVDGNGTLIKRIFENAPFVRSLGIELVSFGTGWCETSLKVTSVLKQQHGLVHAGVLMTLADHSCGGAAATTASDEQDVITVETKVAFLRPAPVSVLLCRAQVLRAGRRLVFTEAEVFTEEKIVVSKVSSTLAFVALKSS